MIIHGLCYREAREYFKKNIPFFIANNKRSLREETKIFIDKEYKKNNGIKDFDDFYVKYCLENCTRKKYGGYPIFYEEKEMNEECQKTTSKPQKKRGRKHSMKD